MVKEIVREMWVFQGYSIRKIESEFNANPDWVSKYGTVSFASVAIYVREARRELENWLDEEFLEKYTGEFVRKRFIMEEQIEKLREAQKYIDFKSGETKDKELYLKFEMAIHNIGMDQMRMMTDIELVLNIKKLNKEKRLKNETLVVIPEKDDKVAKDRGYILNSNVIEQKLVTIQDEYNIVEQPKLDTVQDEYNKEEPKLITVQDVEDIYNKEDIYNIVEPNASN